MAEFNDYERPTIQEQNLPLDTSISSIDYVRKIKKTVVGGVTTWASSNLEYGVLETQVEAVATEAGTQAGTTAGAIAGAAAAEPFADAAGVSAAAALVSEQNAKTSETNAKDSETKAKTSETNAKTSETNSAQSEADTLGYRNEVESMYNTVVADTATVVALADQVATNTQTVVDSAAQVALDLIATNANAQTCTTKAAEAEQSAEDAAASLLAIQNSLTLESGFYYINL